MKKVFPIKLKNVTRAFTLVMLATLVLFTGCNSYNDEIEDLQGQIDGVVTDVNGLKTSVAALEQSVAGMAYIKSITMGTDGKLTITPSTGSAIVYDAKDYVTYDIKLEGNKLIVNGAEKGSVTFDVKLEGNKLIVNGTEQGTVTFDVKLEGNKLIVDGLEKGEVLIPSLTFVDGKLMSGTAVVADLTAWFKNGLTVVDGFLAINGEKTTVAIPVVPAPEKTVKEVALDGTNVKVTYTDGTSTVFANAPIVSTTSANGTLVINGVDTNVKVNYVYSIIDGYLAVNGVKTGVAIPAGNTSAITFARDNEGNIISATVSDGTDSFTVVLNPTNELLSSILFVPSWIDGGVNAIEVGYINGMTAPIGKVLFNESTVVYRFNPTSADVSKTTWKFISNSARLSAASAQNAPGDNSTLFAAPVYTSNNDGSGTFTLNVGTWVEPAAPSTHHLVALQANGKDFYSGAASTVVSDYAKVELAQYNAFISDAKKSNSTTNVYVHYRTAVPAVNVVNDQDFELVVNTPVDLDELVWATADKGGAAERRFETYGFKNYKYEFSLPTYVGIDNVTNQNSFVTLSADNVLAVKTGSSVLDRTPLVLVKLLSSDNKLVAQSYIKFKIVATPTVPPVKPAPVKYTITAASPYTYPSLFVDAAAGVSAGDFKDLVLTWGDINTYIYNPLGLTHNEFRALYGGITPDVAVKVNGTAVAGATIAQYPLITSVMAPDVDTYAMKYQITPMAKFGTTSITYTFDTGAITDAAVEITFEFTVNKPVLDKTILPGYRWNNSATDIMTQGMNAGSNYKMQLYLGEAFTFGTTSYRNVFGSATANKIDDATHEFRFKTTVPPQTGAQVSVTNGTINGTFGTSAAPTTGQLMDLTTTLTTAERVYDMQLVTNYPNGEADVFDFKVHFVNPFTIELASPADFQLIDKVNGTADTEDVMDNYIVKFKGKNIVTKGVAETTNTATTVVATDFVDITNASYGMFYELTPGGSYFTISKAGGNAYNKQSVITWDNAGTQLTSEQTVATVKVKFVSSFAEITRTADNVTVKPE
jgi:hypothetical protein